MKKVSLLLAVLLVLTCCLLAACGGDEDTPSTETSSTATSSEATSSEETTSEAASSVAEESSDDEEPSTQPEDSSEPVEESSEEPSTSYDGEVIENARGDNLALNKSYTGADPSTRDGVKHYNAKLTDGVALDTISYNEGDWFAFYYNADATGTDINAPDQVGTFVIDLENVYEVSLVKINTFVGNASGILPPKSIKVECSADGTNYSTLEEKSFDKPDEGSVIEFLAFSGETWLPAQYIRVTVELQGIFAFINEVEVY